MKKFCSIIFLGTLLFTACEKQEPFGDPDQPSSDTLTLIAKKDNRTSVTICGRTWMKKNLDVSFYRNGDPVPQVNDLQKWAALTTGAWCWYNNDSLRYAATYGKLYNWYAVNDARGLAPAGWHIPAYQEWQTMAGCLGGYSLAGNALKEKGTAHWLYPNTGATNSSGFTALPGGALYSEGTANTFFSDIKQGCYLWTSTELNTSSIWIHLLSYDGSALNVAYGLSKNTGMSVRCLKD